MAPERLSALDTAFLCLEGDATPMHMGAVATFRPRRDWDADHVAGLLAEHAARIPRLRRRVRTGLLPLSSAHWEDDPSFDPARHVAVSSLYDRYAADPLATFAEHWIAEPLDLNRPLWSVQLVTGLPDGDFALLVKFHHALADGMGAVELALALLDDITLPWQRRPADDEPEETSRSPLGAVADTAAALLGQAAESAGIAGSIVTSARPFPLSPTATVNSPSRRIGLVRLPGSDIRTVRTAHGGTTHDVVLAVLAGALREWMINRGQRADARSLRALVPVSLRGRDSRDTGNSLSGYLCDLPVEVDDPVERLRLVREAMARNKEAGPTRGAGALPVLANRLPAGLHRLAAKAAGQAAPLLFDTVVTTVPVPSIPLSLAGARLREVYPFVPLAPHQSVGIAVATYRDGVHVGLQANGHAVSDVGSLADAVTKSMARLQLES
ncbi:MULTISPECIES: wax ester/triacylglycerol synthase family O-acyltransferase [Prauserella salsuginis group]|uniref:Diacylglycerol O-acyltransferase n=1 Tax=Prauserella salsuginis TaxID=387889 RepID=A0ABW6GB68_9PSEU|nr:MULTISPECIES: wax ester/triacylglycerol synthase family O-acyltransferase [Prauserella salsuginis group]MCR3719026.1 acyltransferase, WS/DGAT/MGAT [Prauserella flava]MCR3733596.1 acyltransferase, WS/DGAT/MGAT [Prauserella salsuginis]